MDEEEYGYRLTATFRFPDRNKKLGKKFMIGLDNIRDLNRIPIFSHVLSIYATIWNEEGQKVLDKVEMELRPNNRKNTLAVDRILCSGKGTRLDIEGDYIIVYCIEMTNGDVFEWEQPLHLF